jgi:pimeloyl-ACP methyl ester carboxylesterase
VRHLQANRINLHVGEIAAAGPVDVEPRTAVMVHGMAGDSMASWYLTLAGPLAQMGMRVLLYDLRGHGRSDRPAHGYAFDDFVDDLEALLEQWLIPSPVHLFGNSFGGTVAFGFAARHPDRVAGIATIESAPPIPDWFARISRRFDQARELSHAGGRGAGFDRQIVDVQQLLIETTVGDELPASRLPDSTAFTAVTCPVLSLYGGSSPVRELAEQTKRLLPQARMVVLPGGDHWMLINRRQQVADHILQWLHDTAPTPAWPTEGDSRGQIHHHQ